MKREETVGDFALVMHSHLPWLAHHGSWPVGEEWIYQSWASSYIPVFDVLARLAREGRRNLVTLGMTPVLAAQLDDPHCLKEFETWLGFWSQRAAQLSADPDRALAAVGDYEVGLAHWTTAQHQAKWRAGISPVLRELVDSQAIELLSGPAAHPFQPLLDEQVAEFSLRTGLADTRLRIGSQPGGIWAPECGYRPGLEDIYQDAGVTHFMVDGPTLLGVGRTTADAWTVGDSNVVAFGRDLDVTYRVWSPKKGYPGGPWYRDFHEFHHASGIRPSRVTSTRSSLKAPYEPQAAMRSAFEDAQDFVSLVRQRLLKLREQRGGKRALVVAGYDTELFGHWWHEGPQWLEHVLRMLPRAGVNVTTLDQARVNGAVAGTVSPRNSSWGSGKDWSVWAGPQVQDIIDDNDAMTRRWRKLTDEVARTATTRDPALDQLARNALMALQSDWAFMVTKDSAAAYACDRHRTHHENFVGLASLLEAKLDGAPNAHGRALALAAEQRKTDSPFGHLDGRLLAPS